MVKKDRLFFASVLTSALLVMSVGIAAAQTGSKHQMMPENMHEKMMQSNPSMGTEQMHHGTHGQHDSLTNPHATLRSEARPTLPGQDAFGAIQEIISILEADPATDWASVNITTLRNHLVDMNRLVMNTEVIESRINGGLQMVISGRGRTLQAIQAMVGAHAPMIDGLNGWTVRADISATGATLRVSATDAKEVAHIRALGFYGLMASASHHQAHHLALARGENVHAQ